MLTFETTQVYGVFEGLYLSAKDHAVLMQEAVYAEEEDKAYFVLHRPLYDRNLLLRRFIAVVCETYTDEPNADRAHRVIQVQNTFTKERAIRLVHDQFRIDCYGED